MCIGRGGGRVLSLRVPQFITRLSLPTSGLQATLTPVIWQHRWHFVQIVVIERRSKSNFHPLEVVGRASETQLQVGENMEMLFIAIIF